MRFSTLSLSTSALFALLTACADDGHAPAVDDRAQDAFGVSRDAQVAPVDSGAGGAAEDGGAQSASEVAPVPTADHAALALAGTAELVGVTAPAQAVVALAFSNDPGMTFVSGVFSGESPGAFTLAVSSTPPEEARWERSWARRMTGGEGFAVARLALLPAGHPARLVVADDVQVIDPGALPACAADPACLSAERWCVTGEARCRTVGLGACEAGDCAPLHSAGDGEIQLNDDTPGIYTALSENVLVLWSDAGIAQSSLLLHSLGVKRDLPAGYSVIQLGALRGTDAAPLADGECAADECAELYEAEGLARYNTLHGTHYADRDELRDALPPDAARVIRYEADLLALEIAIERGVNLAGYTSAVVLSPNASLNVRFSADVRDVI